MSTLCHSLHLHMLGRHCSINRVAFQQLAPRKDKPHHRWRLIITLSLKIYDLRDKLLHLSQFCPYCTSHSASDRMQENGFLQLGHDHYSSLQVEPLICGVNQTRPFDAISIQWAAGGALWCPQEAVPGTTVMTQQPTVGEKHDSPRIFCLHMIGRQCRTYPV